MRGKLLKAEGTGGIRGGGLTGARTTSVLRGDNEGGCKKGVSPKKTGKEKKGEIRHILCAQRGHRGIPGVP